MTIRSRVALTKCAGLAAVVLALAACGNTTGDRALSGAGIGAAAGTVGSAVVGGSVLGGALVGGAAGGAIGALTDSDDVDLGEPFWR